MHSWAKNETGFVCEITAEEIPIVDAISTAHPGWVQGTANAADPWLIAHAAASGRTIVTEERRAGDNVQDQNQKIPNVATEQQVDTINFFALARAEGWRVLLQRVIILGPNVVPVEDPLTGARGVQDAATPGDQRWVPSCAMVR
ncbi:DUF4411 family protein [Sphingomonas sp. LR61]|uniref:DUF4411 family protein n=1 Tax=Sphingomonas sp. LR61 TaxID=3050234 RepID=UPI003FA74E34